MIRLAANVIIHPQALNRTKLAAVTPSTFVTEQALGIEHGWKKPVQ